MSQRDLVERLNERHHIYGDAIYHEAAIEIERLRAGQIVAEVDVARLHARIQGALMLLEGINTPDWIKLKLMLLGRMEKT